MFLVVKAFERLGDYFENAQDFFESIIHTIVFGWRFITIGGRGNIFVTVEKKVTDRAEYEEH